MNRPDFRPAAATVPGARSPIHSPASLADELNRAGEVYGESAARRALRRVTARFGHDMFPEYFTRAAAQSMAAVTTGRRIAVVGADGGSGRTTVAACLAVLYASLRRDTTAVLDLGDGPATLGARLGVLEPVGLHRVASRLDGDGARTGLVLHHTTRVSPSLVTAGPQPRGTVLDAEAFSLLLGSLSGAAAISVFDTPAGLDHPATRMLLDSCHAVVLVGRATPLGVDRIHHGLARIGSGVPAVVVLDAVDRADERRRTLPTRLRRDDVDIVDMHWDRHLAAGGRIHLDHLTERHRLDLARLGGRVLELSRHGGGTWR